MLKQQMHALVVEKLANNAYDTERERELNVNKITEDDPFLMVHHRTYMHMIIILIHTQKHTYKFVDQNILALYSSTRTSMFLRQELRLRRCERLYP